MVETKQVELVFIPSPGLSHLISTVETAKLLLLHHRRLAATVLLLSSATSDPKIHSFINSTSSDSNRLKFINLPLTKTPIDQNTHYLNSIDHQIFNVRDAVFDLTKRSTVAGIVLDIFCLSFLDVAGEFGLPAYLFFTASAATLALFHHLVALHSDGNLDFSTLEELESPAFKKNIPAGVLPAMFVDEQFGPEVFFDHFKRLPELKGMMVNTFYEIEEYAVEALVSDRNAPDVFPVGPVLVAGAGDIAGEVKGWLDDQPEKSVVFLCFGTGGCFDEAQIREIAGGLEESGCRFLWSLRRAAEKTGIQKTMLDYDDFGGVLPEGFLERNEKVGRVIGWAPQVAVLAHPAVGGFVSHCGWNSILESVWFGVPIATFPLYAEQQLNAFYLVEEMGMAEAITLDYHMDFSGENPPEIVGQEAIAAAIRRLMAAEGSGVRKKVEEMREKARVALVEGGSSYNAQRFFVEEVMRNIDN